MSVDVVGASVRDWMITSHPVITPRTSVATALRLLREHALPALPVSEGGRFLGLADEPSLLRLTPSEATTLDVYEMHGLLEKLTVNRVVATDVPAVMPGTPLREAAVLIARSQLQVLPVVEGGRLVGLLVWTVVLAALEGGSQT